MKQTLHAAFQLFTVAVATFSCGQQSLDPEAKIKSVEDISSMVVKSPGLFLVHCKDGTTEEKTAADIRNDAVCLGSGSSGGQQFLNCLARDNDGRDPWIAGGLTSDGKEIRYAKFLYNDIKECQGALAAARSIGGKTQLLCTSRDADGRDPWVMGTIMGPVHNLLQQSVFKTYSDCDKALARAKGTASFLRTCVSRDNDGVDPWVHASVTATGELNRSTNIINGLNACLNNL